MAFIHDDFLLSTPTARRLYHEHAAGLPIFDYHCHLPPADLAANRTFGSLYDAWLAGDHYKWRAMRADGVDEQLITGDADPYDKFLAWAAVVPHTLGNPLYHWSHLELKRYFDLDATLNADSAPAVWEQANAKLARMPVAAILDRFKVALIGTTDDPTDTLEHHAKLAEQPLGDTTIIPSFRPDKAHTLDRVEVWNGWVDKLAAVSAVKCDDFDGFLAALRARHAFFHKLGCRASDHGLTHLPDAAADERAARKTFRKARGGEHQSAKDRDRFRATMMRFFGQLDAEAGWAHQLHLGAMRNNNAWAMQHLGPDTGFDSVGDFRQGPGLRRHLGTLAADGTLPRVVLYNLNPSDNYLFATMAGNFQGSTAGSTNVGPAHVQFGSGWWFLDQTEAMTWQLRAHMNLGLLRRFVGMLTDSRSFLSYPRHEYFRRLVCEILGGDVERGAIPDDDALLGELVRGVSFKNVRSWFGIPLRGRYA